MPMVKIPDAGGDTMILTEYEGARYPAFDIEVIANVSSFKTRPDDILICAYPKSGMHWLAEIFRRVLFQRVDFSLEESPIPLLEHTGGTDIKDWPSSRLVCTHMTFDKLPVEAVQKQCKIVQIHRNPKDIAVSYYNMIRKLEDMYQYKGSWENYLPGFLDGKFDFGSWFDYVRGWEKVKEDHPEIPIYTMTYEDMKENSIQEMKSVSSFIGKNPSEEFLEAVHAATNLEKFKRIKGQEAFYRKGVGDWKNWFTVAQNESFDRVYRRKMAGSNLKMRFELNSDHDI